MLQFLPMLMKGMQSASVAQQDGGSDGANFMQMLGVSGGQNKSDKNIGMQFANAGLQLPNTPSAQQMVAQLPPNMNMGNMQQGSQAQRQPPQTFNPLIQMLLNGGR